jgi:DNA-binding transcriptional MocR family regulator
MDFLSRLSQRTRGLTPSPIRKLVPLMRQPGMISFGGGYPNPDTFAFEKLQITFKSGGECELNNGSMIQASQYGPTDAHADLKPHIQKWHDAKDGVLLENDQIQILNGAQEGLHIMAYLFLDPGDCVALSEPAYPGALGAFKAFTQNFIPFPVDAEGTVTETLHTTLMHRLNHNLSMPKFLYEVPNGHNPAGVALSAERRHHLLRIASEFDLIVLEDDPYQLLQLEDRPILPSLQSMDTEGRVIRLDSFSKIFAPGLRIGYASGPPEIIQYFQLYKQGTNLHTSSMVQSMLAGFFEQHGPDGFRKLIQENCGLYRRNRDAMIEAARRHLPSDIAFHVPGEGMFVWFELPGTFDAERMVNSDGTDLKILLVPGQAFSTTGGLKHFMRASFSMPSPAEIDEGMKRFATMISREKNRLKND